MVVKEEEIPVKNESKNETNGFLSEGRVREGGGGGGRDRRHPRQGGGHGQHNGGRNQQYGGRDRNAGPSMGETQEARRHRYLKKSVIFLGEKQNAETLSLYDGTTIEKMMSLDQEIEAAIVPVHAKDPEGRAAGVSIRQEAQFRNRSVILDTLRDVVVNVNTKSSLLAVLVAIWMHGHHGRFKASALVKADTEGEEVEVKIDEDDEEMMMETKAEQTKEEGLTKEEGGLLKHEAEDDQGKWKANHAKVYLDLVKQVIGRIHTFLEDCLESAEVPWTVCEVQLTNGLRFLTHLANLQVVNEASLLDWLIDFVAVAEELKDAPNELSPGAGASVILSIVLAVLSEANPALIARNGDQIAELRTRIGALLERDPALPKSVLKHGGAHERYDDEYRMASGASLRSELLANWHAFETLVNELSPNRFRLAFYEFPMVKEHPTLSKVLLLSDGTTPLVLMPFNARDSLKDRFFMTNENYVKPMNQIHARFTTSVMTVDRLEQILPRVVHLTMDERTFVERYVRHTFVTFRGNTNECARAVLSLPLVHDSLTFIMVDVIIQDIIRLPNSAEQQVFYLNVLHAMNALEPTIKVAVEFAVVAACENLPGLSHGMFALERFVGNWWGYLSEEPEVEEPIPVEGADLPYLERFLSQRGGFFTLKYWYHIDDSHTIKEDKYQAKDSKNDAEIKDEDKTDKDKKRRLMETNFSFTLRKNAPLVRNLLAKAVQHYCLNVSPSTALERLVGPLLASIPIGDLKPVLEYLDPSDTDPTARKTLLKEEEKEALVKGETDLTTKEEQGLTYLESHLIAELMSMLVTKGLRTSADPEAVQTMNNIYSLLSDYKVEEFAAVKADPDQEMQEEGDAQATAVKMEQGNLLSKLAELPSAGKVFSAIFLAMLMRGHPTPAHFKKVVTLYSPLLMPFMDSVALDSQSTRSMILVEIFRFWQFNPIRGVQDLGVLVQHDLMTWNDVVTFLVAALTNPDGTQQGLMRPANEGDSGNVSIGNAIFLPNGLLHDHIIAFILKQLEKSVVEEPAAVAEAVQTLVAAYEALGSQNGVLVAAPENDDAVKMERYRASLWYLRLLDQFGAVGSL